MSKSKENLNSQIIALFSGQSSILTTPKLYVDLTGKHSLALVLNQCVFWSNKSSLKDGWFYKQYDVWHEETHIQERTLRRYFEKLSTSGWITTKTKMVNGKNTLHIRPNIDKITDSITNLLSKNNPIRTTCQSSTEIAPKTCTNIAPSGQFVRTEPDSLSDSSITYNDNQIKKTYCTEALPPNRTIEKTSPPQSSSSYFFSELTDRNILSQKLESDRRSDEEFLSAVENHVNNHSDQRFSRSQRIGAAIKLLKKLNSQGMIFYVKGTEPLEKPKTQSPRESLPCPFTKQELEIAAEYQHALKHSLVDAFFLNPEKRATAQAIHTRVYAKAA